jgi:hypothetical protein
MSWTFSAGGAFANVQLFSRPQLLAEKELRLSGILIIQEFPCNEESMGFFKIKAQMGL